MSARPPAAQASSVSASTEAAVSARPWFKVTDYAARHGVTRQTVWNWIRKGAVDVTRKAPRCAVRVRDRER